MKIQKLTITQDELNVAVQAFLKLQGVDLPVASCEKERSYSTEYTVEFVEPKDDAASPPAVEPAE